MCRKSWLKSWLKSARNKHGYFNVPVPLCRKSTEPKPIFFGKWPRLININFQSQFSAQWNIPLTLACKMLSLFSLTAATVALISLISVFIALWSKLTQAAECYSAHARPYSMANEADWLQSPAYRFFILLMLFISFPFTNFSTSVVSQSS